MPKCESARVPECQNEKSSATHILAFSQSCILALDFEPLYKWISSHIAKRTYVNMFFRGGGRMESIMMTAGNSDRKTMKHYLEIDNTEIRREVDSIFNNVKL